MNLIVAVSENWGIGHKNELLFRISEDLQRFKKLTTGKVVVMGHNTFKSLGKPLPDRINIVLSKTEKIPGVITCNSLEELNLVLENYPPDDIFVIGGEKIYNLLLNRCKFAYVTKIEATPPADAFMPNLEKLENWQLTHEGLPEQQTEPVYRYNIFTNLGIVYINPLRL